ncbi:drug/metabolite transporter (DMT)-like permease [Streptosporangium becharense]|uniref:Drug/metabolite transporter (DMT)-like permease n=1 Tax=Streptosporangium becharense TaxID=1816182 RepID=A0A7W9IF05_9ACTN|nr:hypothetical protein [Streptosporangium becharense]MBB2909531.1 drug/metabolite transporter (DMT)-like permease [Streptosporangium becharense]MBB5819512.1 drug/metabolite transporter (DMT)-like permease [Streptosporangium becharense]
MRGLSPNELERLLRSHRRLRTSMLVTIAVIIVVVVLLARADVPLPSGLGVGAGVGIGLLLLIPQRRLLNELGLTSTQAKAIIAAERERRSGLAALPPEARARREARRAGVFLVAGLVLVVVFAVAAFYFFGHAGRTVEEDAPPDPWFGISFFAGFAALCAGPAFLWQAYRHKESAASWRERAAEEAP